jgi:phosphoribosylaminoimidazole (AIR) synthetase
MSPTNLYYQEISPHVINVKSIHAGAHITTGGETSFSQFRLNGAKLPLSFAPHPAGSPE